MKGQKRVQVGRGAGPSWIVYLGARLVRGTANAAHSLLLVSYLLVRLALKAVDVVALDALEARETRVVRSLVVCVESCRGRAALGC